MHTEVAVTDSLGCHHCQKLLVQMDFACMHLLRFVLLSGPLRKKQDKETTALQKIAQSADVSVWFHVAEFFPETYLCKRQMVQMKTQKDQ